MQFTDEQIINCALVSLKHLRVMYTYFTEEAGTPELFTKADQLFNEIKVSLRSNSFIDVAKIAAKFNGGGHVKAAGFSLKCNTLSEAERIVFEALKKEFN